MHILTANGNYVPLESVVTLSKRRGFETLRHDSGELAVKVTANVDYQIANVNLIQTQIARDVLPNVSQRFDVECAFVGRAADQADSAVDMKMGTLYALAMIYIVLAWVFSLLSLFGLLGLTGIVVNDSIILVTFYQELRSTGMAIQDAIIEAACQRLRFFIAAPLQSMPLS
ncbi:MAG: efflux RND transporter permease subunit [Pseudomonadota bacterium]